MFCNSSSVILVFKGHFLPFLPSQTPPYLVCYPDIRFVKLRQIDTSCIIQREISLNIFVVFPLYFIFYTI